MNVFGNGVLKGSQEFFYNPSLTAKKTLLYPIALGEYSCDETYKTERNSYDSFMVIYIKKGSFDFILDGKKYIAKLGNILILDCYTYHCYRAFVPSESFWFHFDGSFARAYYDMMTEKSATFVMAKDPFAFEMIFNKMFDIFKHGGEISEPLLFKHIVDILTLMVDSRSPSTKRSPNSLFEDTISYIHSHLTEPLTIEDLSRRCSLSPYHFVRVFKREIGYSPHEFIVNVRVNRAKYYLVTTQNPIKHIATICGFYNDSNFCTTFKKLTGVTPITYRNNNSVTE